jgi:hypothetical protein
VIGRPFVDTPGDVCAWRDGAAFLPGIGIDECAIKVHREAEKKPLRSGFPVRRVRRREGARKPG